MGGLLLGGIRRGVGVGGYATGAGDRSDDGMWVLLNIFVCLFLVGHCTGGEICMCMLLGLRTEFSAIRPDPESLRCNRGEEPFALVCHDEIANWDIGIFCSCLE